MPVETERRLSMGVRWAWTPGKHGRRVGMGAGRNANIGRNAGWYRLVFGQASFLDGLLSPMGSGCWGGCPNHIFGIAIVNWKADRLISCCSGDRRQFEGWCRVHSALLRLHCYFVIAFASI